MKFIDKQLKIIERCIKYNEYEELETQYFELKDLSNTRSWKELYKTTCAFLNTNGGILVMGIRERANTKNKKYYEVTGFNYNNEAKLKEIAQQFQDVWGKNLSLSKNIHIEIIDFLDKKIVILNISELLDDEKFIFYKGTPYKRVMTGDHEISSNEIEQYEELKQEIISFQELSLVKNTTLSLINIDTLNDYISRINKTRSINIKYKTNVDSAISFLERKFFIQKNQLTLLGMLACGDYVEDYIGNKAAVNCSVEMPTSESNRLRDIKQRYQDNIIPLIENSIAFVWRNIQVGILYHKGGTAAPEYPEELIRESINNAIAHRNYTIDRPVIIRIKPNESLMIQNPGTFFKRQLIFLNTKTGKIRRILRMQRARNGKITELLRIFKKFEGENIGLTSLVDACLQNSIDVPYYILGYNEIKLFIPQGKVFDEKMDFLFNGFEGYLLKKNGKELTEDEKIMLSFFYKSEKHNRLEHYTILLTMDNNHKDVIAHLEEKELIFANAESPRFYPIYQVDRNLMKDDFTEELCAIFGNDWHNLKIDYQKVLNAIYLHNHFSNIQVSANAMANYIFTIKYGNISDIKKYESYRAKVRSIIRRLEKKEFIIRKVKKKPDFYINKNFTKKNNLFS